MFVSFDKKPTKEQMIEAWEKFRGPAQELNLPSAPKQFLHYFTEPDRPQRAILTEYILRENAYKGVFRL